MKKVILDACCGSRMMWFDKKNPNALYIDKRKEDHVLCDGRELEISPDIQADFTDLPFADNTFKVVAFDPPHLIKVGDSSWIFKKYGKLPEDWRSCIRLGINECLRVVDIYGLVVFKWNEDQVKVSEILKAIDHKPLFGHTTGRHGKTHWMVFMKEPI
jgi:hypothetical protein